jgi:hypothetical protein
MIRIDWFVLFWYAAMFARAVASICGFAEAAGAPGAAGAAGGFRGEIGNPPVD